MAAFKYLCYAVATLLILPLALPELSARKLLGRSVFLQTQGQMLSLVPGKLGCFLRNAYYHLTLQRCPFGICLHFGMRFTQPGAEVGERVNIGMGAVIGCATIGDSCIIAGGAHILSGRHAHGVGDPEIPFLEQPGVIARVHIGRNCWLGTNSVVMADLGENCIVGAGSVVTRSFPEGKVIIGNPARVVGDTFPARSQQPQALHAAGAPARKAG
jgi:virginiamycin A acetyltransferase